MNTDKKIRFAVVGCGHIGKRHAEMITRDEKAELVALCDIRPKEELGIEAYPVPFAKNLDELLENCICIKLFPRIGTDRYSIYTCTVKRGRQVYLGAGILLSDFAAFHQEGCYWNQQNFV